MEVELHGALLQAANLQAEHSELSDQHETVALEGAVPGEGQEDWPGQLLHLRLSLLRCL